MRIVTHRASFARLVGWHALAAFLAAALLSAGVLRADAATNQPATKASDEPGTAAAGYIHDYAGIFSKEAVGQAERTIDELKSRHRHELVVETYPAIPDSLKHDFTAKGKERFFEDWAEERFKAQGISGVGVLICMDPRRLQIVVGNQTQRELFTAADRVALTLHLTATLRAGQYDEGLVKTATFILRKFNEHALAGAAEPGAPATAPSGNDAEPSRAHSGVFSDTGDARQVIFVCDNSGMTTKLASLKAELEKAIDGLGSNRSFNVIFFQNQGYVALDKAQLLAAERENQRKAHRFLGEVTAGGTTDPMPGLNLAFEQHPQLIYLVADGDFPDNEAVKDQIAKLNTDHKVRINTIAFGCNQDTDPDFPKLLEAIASDNGGTFNRAEEVKLDKLEE